MRLAGAVVCAGTSVAILALLQSIGCDPFQLAGWEAVEVGGSRMRVYATLGNPNFVAAFLTASLPVTISVTILAFRSLSAGRRWLVVAPVLQALGLVVTGSRAPVLACAAVVLWLLIHRRFRTGAKAAAAGGLLLTAVLALSSARPLGLTLQGRFYLWKVTVRHVVEKPVLGRGLGAFALLFPEWETRYWKQERTQTEARFFGFQDHAHNDYLEFLVDRGVLGLATFWLAVGLLLYDGMRRQLGRDPLGLGASCGVAALAGIALVDFPLHRPAELFLFWTLLAVLYLSGLSAKERC
jgi:O-antigen ligase